MATANFEIGNKEFEVRFIRESGYPPTKNELSGCINRFK